MGDLISRQEALDFIKDHSYPVKYDRNSTEQGMTITGIEQALNEMPSVQVKEKTGIWLNSYGIFKCSLCGYCFEHEGYKQYFNFCPCCGAKMGSGNELWLK